jgi:nucleoside 2-deoxyribosyltransferase-like protein
VALILKPPAPLTFDSGISSVFLAGSIEMGQAEDWQTVCERALQDLQIVILNPRRTNWDAGWVQAIDNPQFREQVEWELTAQERASVIAMYFAPASKAPITLLELGLFAGSGKLIVCCPEGFWRKGNVDIICARHRIPMATTLAELVERVRGTLLRSVAKQGSF